jgi:hypothetical protein
MARIARLVRSSLVDVLNQDYILAHARAACANRWSWASTRSRMQRCRWSRSSRCNSGTCSAAP